MRLPHRLILATILGGLATGVAPVIARADFTGFGNFSGFTVNQDDSGSAPTISGGTLHVTNGGDEARDVFYDTPQNISQFTVSFTYSESGGVDIFSGDQGASLVLQNSPSGANSVSSGRFGYGGFPGQSIG